MQRLLERNPELVHSTVRDSILIPGEVIFDTSFAELQTWDTSELAPATFATLTGDTVIITRTKVIQAKPTATTLEAHGEVSYTDPSITVHIPVRVVINTKNGQTKVNVIGLLGKVTQRTKVVQTTGITQEQIRTYKRQGMRNMLWILLAIIAGGGIIYGMFKIYGQGFGAGIGKLKNLGK
jgi:hypothetical protein